MKLKTLVPIISAGAVALGVAACGGTAKAPGVALAPSGGLTALTATTPAPASTTPTTPTTPAAAVKTPTSGPLSKEPSFTVPGGPAPHKLIVKDLITGTGATAKKGDTLDVNYVGKLYTSGKIFDASWRDTPGSTFSFVLGQGQVIPGWDQGLVGMKVGGRRELIIPANLAYGKQGSGSTIPPNAALVFVVDLVKIS